ncbi:histamine H2 receptor-like [Saccoglossus kowalevskii]|uniref:Histamine H2 receptor-like n=1 Tax=Saccoglossus kowalevskii TaxID=10224 RepID=A0ABM0MQF7_SACKO|nr:PREDICTED: histamine H2 receptor-like [Saccoglossus kowalevskii]
MDYNNSNATNITNEDGETTSDVNTVMNMAIVTIGIIGLFGNALVCLVFLKIRQLRTLTNYLIVHQAVIDFITCSIIVITYLGPQFTHTLNNAFGEIICRVWKSAYLLWTCFLASTLNLVVITFERYCAIVYPLHYPSILSDCKVKIALVMVWVISFLFKSFKVYVQYFDIETGLCILVKIWPSPAYRTFVGVANILIQYFLPLITMTCAYIHIYLVLKKRTSAASVPIPGENASTSRDGSMMRARKNVLRMLFLVFLAYAVCWTPNQFVFLAQNIGVQIDFRSRFYHFTVVWGFLNTCINPFIYALKYRQFQKGVRLVFCPKRTSTLGDSTIAAMSIHQGGGESLEDGKK